MKIESNFDLQTNQLQITFDSEMQDLFLGASRIVAKHSDAGSYAAFARELYRNQEWDFADGGRFLLELIRSKRRIIRTDQDRVWRLMLFLSLTTIQLVKAGKSTTQLVHALNVVAKISASPMISIPLPPAGEVMDRQNTPKSAWKSYQLLQSTPKSEPPYLSVAQCYELSVELKKTGPLRSSLKMLLASLEASSLFYRFALEAVADAEKAEIPGKAKK